MAQAFHPHLRRNFWMHCLEGGFYMTGLAFFPVETLLPSVVKELGGPNWLVALLPVLLVSTFSAPGVFVSPLVERLHRLKPFVCVFAALQRLPYLLAGLLMLLVPMSPGALLALLVLTPITSGLVGGVGVQAWMEMVTRMIPAHLRASGWASRYAIQGVIGLSAGPAIHWMLTHHPGASGYGWLHLILFGFLALSFMAQVCMEERPDSRVLHQPRSSYGSHLRELPGLLRAQPWLLRFVFVRFTGTGYLMLVSFLSIHALHVTGRPQADLGHFVLAQMLGALCGNLIAGWWGNRNGGRIVMLSARALCLGLSAALPFVHDFSGFLAAFFVLGFGLFVDRVGDLTLGAELCPVQRRPTYQSILGFCQMVCFITAMLLSGWIYTATQSFNALVALCGAFAVASIAILWTIPEVRGNSRAGHDSPSPGENVPMM